MTMRDEMKGDECTLKLLCTRVSSKSKTKHLRPACAGVMGGKSGLGIPS